MNTEFYNLIQSLLKTREGKHFQQIEFWIRSQNKCYIKEIHLEGI